MKIYKVEDLAKVMITHRRMKNINNHHWEPNMIICQI
jgi:hypothetical protein